MLAIMSRVLKSFWLLAIIALCSLQAIARQKTQEKRFRIGVAVNQVFLSVNVRSLQGGVVRGLKKEEFRIREDGVEQTIVNYYSSAVPVQVVLLIDVSRSTMYSQGEIRRGALKFAQSLGSEDRVAIITFNDAPRLILDWTDDIGKVQYALESIYAKGNTVLNDALYVTFDDLLKGVEGKKAVILLTDGVDTGSLVSFEEVVDLASRSEAMVYIVSKLEEYWAIAIASRLRWEAQARIIPKEYTDDFIIQVKHLLQRMANVTGGKVLEPKDFNSLVDVYAQVAEELKNQYYISYIPSNIIKDGEWRSIEASVKRAGVVASTRPGYYAPSSEDGSSGR